MKRKFNRGGKTHDAYDCSVTGGAVYVDTPQKLHLAVESAACTAIGNFMMSGFRKKDLPLFADAVIGKLAESGDISVEAIKAVVNGEENTEST